MKFAFFALASFTRILSTEALTSGSVALTWTPNAVDYVQGTTATSVDIVLKVTNNLEAARQGGADSFEITSVHSSLFSANGAVDVSVASQAGNTGLTSSSFDCTNAVSTKLITCTLKGNAVVNPNVDLSIKLIKTNTNLINALPNAPATFAFTAKTSRDATVGALNEFTVNLNQVKSASVTLPPSSHVVGTVPKSFAFQMQPRSPLPPGATITITSNEALFGGSGNYQTSSISQPGVPLLRAAQFTCARTSNTELTCTLSTSTIITTSNLSVSLLPSASATLTALPTAAGTEVTFTYATSVDTTALGPQSAFKTQQAQMKSASVALTPNTYYTLTTPTEIKFTIQLRQPLDTVNQNIIITSTPALWTAAGPLTVNAVNNTGGAATISNIGAASDATGKITTITLKQGASIVNSAPFEISLGAGSAAKFAALGAPTTQTTFSLRTSLTTLNLALQGWTVAAAPTETAGTTFLPSAVSKGATCFAIYSSKGFAQGNQVQIGKYTGNSTDSEIRVIQNIYPSSDCTGTALSSRRLAPGLASIKPEAALVNSYLANSPVEIVYPSYGSTCFPGDATVDVYGRGATRMTSLSVGDRVLVENGEFEPVLSFLHKVPGVAKAMTMVHSQGTFQASENHIVFTSRGDMPVSALRPGDELLVQSGPSTILTIGQAITATGMYAPFTASGALVVDGVVASNYGTPTSKSSLPHAAAHAAFFSLRVYYYLDLAMVAKVLFSLAVVMMLPLMRSHKL